MRTLHRIVAAIVIGFRNTVALPPTADPGRTARRATRSLTVVTFVAVFLSGCIGRSVTASVAPGVPPGPTTAGASPNVLASPYSPAPTHLETPLASPVSPTHVAGVVLPGQVLYDRTTDGDVHSIYLLTAGSETRLTEPGEYQLGRISPDYRQILVLPVGDLPSPITGGALDLDGKHFTPLPRKDPTLNLLPAAWSPDGTHIAFIAWDDADASRTGIYSARSSDGGDLFRVTTRPGPLVDVPLDYSPDGKWLLFYRTAHPDPDPHIGGSLWTMRIDGTDARQINGTAHPADWARWSPDGRRGPLFADRGTSFRRAARSGPWRADGCGCFDRCTPTPAVDARFAAPGHRTARDSVRSGPHRRRA